MERDARIALRGLLGLIFWLAAAPVQADDGATHTDRLIVKYRTAAARIAATTKPQTKPWTRALAAPRFVRETATGASVWQLPSAVSLADAAALAQAVARDPDVEYAEPDRVMQTTTLTDDPFYGAQWHLFEARGGINLPPAWALTHGAASVVVAVLDTGIRPHEDLPHVLPGYDFVSDAARGNDGNGRDGDATDPGDWVTFAESQPDGAFAGCRPRGSSWHGTHVAGIIGAQGNNAKGVAGINWESPILPVRVLGKCGGYNSDVVDAMYWAAGFSVPGAPVNPNPARVLNLSLGGDADRCPSSYQEAVDTLTANGVVVVVSAGNSSRDVARTTPANCAGVIAVAASDRSGERAWYSNYGGVTLAAPGGVQFFNNDPEGVWSTLNDGTAAPATDSYRSYQGTSMAAPQVTGAVSLMLAIDPLLNASSVVELLNLTARAFPVGGFCAGEVGRCGAGLLDAGKAVEVAAHRRALADRAMAEQAEAEARAIASGGGGGCTLGGRGVDPLFPALIVISLGVLARRAYLRN